MRTSRWIPAAAVLLCLVVPAAPAADLPRKAPDVTINLGGGKTAQLSQYKGKAVVMAFILTYCSHCQKAIGFLNKDQATYGPRGLQVLAAAIEQDAPMALPMFIKTYQPPFPVGFINVDAAVAFMQHPVVKVPMMPMMAFIDKQGNIRAQAEGDDPMFGEGEEQNLHKQIEAILKDAPAVAPAKKAAPAPKKSTAK